MYELSFHFKVRNKKFYNRAKLTSFNKWLLYNYLNKLHHLHIAQFVLQNSLVHKS